MDEKSLKKIFGISQYPAIDFGLEDIPQQARNLTGKVSISGVQPKLFVKFDKKKNVLVSDAQGEYILKPQTLSFPHLPENEECCMEIAQRIGIDVPDHCLVLLKDKSLAYVVKRFDRKNREKIHQEDFFQILGPKDKYIGSVEKIGRALKGISSVPGLDVQLFFERVVFYFLVGNGDAHFKNYSIAYREDGQIRLTPAYDIVCSRLVAKDDESALAINGKNNDLERKDFEALAAYLTIPARIRYESFKGKERLFIEIIKASQLPEAFKENFVTIVQSRFKRLGL